jgi:spore coat polysaccharide biosynthesis predicted glycosyltransferase SpsG
MSPHVALVTEGGADVGLGHVSRCMALARALLAEGARATFLLPPEPRVAALLAELRGACEQDAPGAGGRAEAIAEAWPAAPARAVDALRALAPDVVVVDSYRASPDFLRGLRGVAGCVVAIDDLADRPLPVDVVVNGGVAAASLPYRRSPDTVFLLGSRYALLDPGFADMPARPVSPRVSRLLVTLGGGRWAGDLVAVLEAADAVLSGAAIDVAAGPFAAPELDAVACGARNGMLIHRERFGLRPLMLAADLAVCGAGMTLYELSATGTPAIAVCMADNQAPNARAFGEAGAAVPAGRAGTPGLRAAVEAALRRLDGDPAARAGLAARARALVDGRGAMRVAREIVRPALARR